MNREFAPQPIHPVHNRVEEQPREIPRGRNRHLHEVSQQSARVLTRVDGQLSADVVRRDTDFVHEIEQLRREGDRVGIQRSSSGNGEMQNYDIMLARWGFNRARTEEEKQHFRETELDNITTALKERKNTVDSTWTLTFGPDRKIYNPACPDESWEKVLKRGVDYREGEGSHDLAREQAEYDGFLQVQTILGDPDARVGTKFVTILPPSDKKDTPYVKNFVDIFELQEDPETKERSIACTRFASSTDIDGYATIVDDLAPQFSREKGVRDDAWLLSHPIEIAASAPYTDAHDIFSKHFAKDGEAMSSQEFQELYQVALPFILYYLDQLTSEKFDPLKVATSWNTVLHSLDNKELRKQMKETPIFVSGSHQFDQEELHRRVGGFVSKFGQEEVQEVKAGCGSSGGVGIKKESGMFGFTSQGKNSGIFGNSVAQFGKKNGEEEKKEHNWFECSECNWKADGPIGESACGGCGFTKEKYKEKYGVSC